MSFIFNNEIRFEDSPNLDAFGRLRVSNPVTISDNKFLCDKDLLRWDEKIVSGSSIWTSASTIDLQLSAITNSRVVRQTKSYLSYQPGKSLFVLLTGILNTKGGESGLVSKIGFFDDKNDKSAGLLNGNGVFFQLSGTQMSVVLRNTIVSSSTQVDTIVPQSQWNFDNFSGTGGTGNPSGLSFDASKAQLFWFSIEWLGVGRVQAGFTMNGSYYVCHNFNSANTLSSTYMNTASLPVRYEFHNVGGVTPTSKMVQICSSVISEGGYDKTGRIFSVDRGTNSKTISAFATNQPILSIRLSDFGIRKTLKVIGINILCTSTSPIRWSLSLNPTILSGASWTGNVSSNSHTQVDTDAVYVSGGTLINSGYFSDNVNMLDIVNDSTLDLVSNISGGSDIITLAVDDLSSGAETIYGGLKYLEIE